MVGSKMFPFITDTFNPLGGVCSHGCKYCWCRGMINRFKFPKYIGDPKIIHKVLRKTWKGGEFVFICDMLDLMAEKVPSELITEVFRYIEKYPDTKFLVQTKNPARYLKVLAQIPSNVVVGATIESDIDYPGISKAPAMTERIKAMKELAEIANHHRFVSVEPILEFTPKFLEDLHEMDLWAVAVGLDNYGWKLPEPKLKKTRWLMTELAKFTDVIPKTIKRAWNEC